MFWVTHHIKSEVILFSIIIILANICCEKIEMDHAWITYTISKGEHKCDWDKIEYTNEEELHFKVIFDSSCIYQTKDSTNKSDINKLYGFTDCNGLIHDNSARIGWRWLPELNKIELLAYCYVNGNVQKKPLKKVDLFNETECEIKIDKNKYLFSINNETADTIERGCDEKQIKRFYCYPYFGGDESAPHTIKIKIMDL